MKKADFTKLVQEFRFKELFNQMGWDNKSGSFIIDTPAYSYQMDIICEKSGFMVLQCTCVEASSMPVQSERIRVQSIIKKRYYEHLLIFVDNARQNQVWQYAYKPLGKPLKTIATHYNVSQDPQLLYQRTSGMVFEIDENDNITIVDVTRRVSEQIDQNSDKVTKKFYDGFKKQHREFLRKIAGITADYDRGWYASIMLNRLMFCYFIQKRGFLDGDLNYLKNRLLNSALLRGRNQFYTFYRNFLLQLFHQQLGTPHNAAVTSEFGKIPYLNGGIFAVHELESKYGADIEIPDEAFETLFDFFDQYNWHLDTKITASGKDINPDVTGYIFEKYINDRAQMGAYYTKEDITDYIGKNTIIPYLFDDVQRRYKDPFAPDGEIWRRVKDSEDQYIYPAVKKGIVPSEIWADLPADVAAGLNPDQQDLVELRRCWNRPAPDGVALPTEIWREVIARRKKYQEVMQHIANGDVQSINDIITYNLDIRQFALDLINETDDPKLVYQFYNALKSITILDPTCGSGAFLFAAMNILEDLYEACIQKMDSFAMENPGHSTTHLKKELEPIKHPSHPNLQYYIYKSIILNNLYGVDIMQEAVEIAKLRLFLKLVACVDPDKHHPNYGLEPLPDIDFNIRCGNTLVGYANWKEIKNASSGYVHNIAEFDESINLKAMVLASAHSDFNKIQLTGEYDYLELRMARQKLITSLKEVNGIFDRMLFDSDNDIAFEGWKAKNNPFYWWVEFYEIIGIREGFDVIIGNPPYVEYSSKSFEYTIRGFKTESCGNLYAFIIERSKELLNRNGRMSMIVPVSIVNGPSYASVRNILQQGLLYNMNISGDTHPSTLFSGVQHNLTIFTWAQSAAERYSTGFIRFYEEYRPCLFQTVCYVCADRGVDNKVGSEIEVGIFRKMIKHRQISLSFVKMSLHSILMKTTSGSHYKLFFKQYPHFEVNGERRKTSSLKPLYFATEMSAMIALGVFNSNLFNLWWCSLSDGRNVTMREVGSFPFDDFTLNHVKTLSEELMRDLDANSSIVTYHKANGITKYTQYKPRNSKAIVDKIDYTIKDLYGFTNEEIDYVINYDVKFRMGVETDNEF